MAFLVVPSIACSNPTSGQHPSSPNILFRIVYTSALALLVAVLVRSNMACSNPTCGQHPSSPNIFLRIVYTSSLGLLDSASSSTNCTAGGPALALWISSHFRIYCICGKMAPHKRCCWHCWLHHKCKMVGLLHGYISSRSMPCSAYKSYECLSPAGH